MTDIEQNQIDLEPVNNNFSFDTNKIKSRFNLITGSIRSGMDYSSLHKNEPKKCLEKEIENNKIQTQSKKALKATKILQRVNKKYSLKLTDDEIKFIVDSAYYDSKESEGKNGI